MTGGRGRVHVSNDWAGGDPATERSHMFCRVLVGYDGSDGAQRALRIAAALAADLGADLRVLVVARPPAHAETPEELEQAEAAERESLSLGLGTPGQPTHLGPDLDVRVVFADDPARALAEHAEEHGFDLVVVGRHGREQATHRGIGRSLDELLRRGGFPVLVA